jgi:hypothetical protein
MKMKKSEHSFTSTTTRNLGDKRSMKTNQSDNAI